MKLSIVIPAYNEEQAIASIIERCIAAREEIIAQSPVVAIEIIVVSDGSTDQTAAIAAEFRDIRLIVFEKNRGYGAAIQRGFDEASGDVLGFLDADGTCDPCFFAVLCRTLLEGKADVAIGSRLGPTSRMPAVRRIGNRVYAFILSLLSNRVVTDTASGMRVLRRSVLHRLYPLPTGLHFTPAMSARVLMDEQLVLVECPMPYAERVGVSKLHVLRDGWRFFQTIFEMTLMWRPTKVFLSAAAACVATMALLAMHPIEQWWRTGQLDEDVIYRLLFCLLLGSAGATLVSAAVVGEHLRRLAGDGPMARSYFMTLLDAVYSPQCLALVSIPMTIVLLALVGSGLWTRITAGFIETHWSRFVLAGLITFSWGQVMITTFIVRLAQFHQARKPLLESARLLKEGRARTRRFVESTGEEPRSKPDDVVSRIDEDILAGHAAG